ncbi:uncharacterized protein LOC141729316 [Zonotrichia albicollis]|uniref:uncharacterized protein LOC141729316 n=1 Tax=Zonotrichia albicollis TaxID=44394 RepID=UPI003D80CEC1
MPPAGFPALRQLPRGKRSWGLPALGPYKLSLFFPNRGRPFSPLSRTCVLGRADCISAPVSLLPPSPCVSAPSSNPYGGGESAPLPAGSAAFRASSACPRQKSCACHSASRAGLAAGGEGTDRETADFSEAGVSGHLKQQRLGRDCEENSMEYRERSTPFRNSRLCQAQLFLQQIHRVSGGICPVSRMMFEIEASGASPNKGHSLGIRMKLEPEGARHTQERASS